jgi:hypothetical protein
MRNIGNHGVFGSRLLWLLIAPLFLLTLNAFGAGKAATELRFAVLKTKTAAYTNVTVTQVTKKWVFILHENGVCNIKPEDLTLETRTAIGYDKIVAAADEDARSAHSGPTFNFKFSAVGKFASDWEKNGWQKIKATFNEMAAGNAMELYLIFAIAGLTYLFVSALFWMICRKTHSSPGPLVWVPVLQLIPLLRAANMSRVWFFASFVPVVNIIALIVWAIKICKTRGKSPFVAFLLILPPTTVFAFLYLAFSRSAPVNIRDNEPLALQFA